MRTVPLFLLCLLLGGCPGPVGPSPDAALPDLSELTGIVQNALPQLGGNAGLLVLRKDGTVLYKKYFGSFDDQTYLPIASASKMLSMATVLTLVDDGKLDLDDPLGKIYPAVFAKPATQTITMRQLMSHTSGFEALNSWLSARSISLQEAVRGMGLGGAPDGKTLPSARVSSLPNGRGFVYGGVSMQIAGGVAEKVSGKRWDALFREKIGDPCAMPHTDYGGIDRNTNFYIGGGAGSRMVEYANFLLMLLNDGKFKDTQVLSKASVDAMLSDQTHGAILLYSPYGDDPTRKHFRYGLGCWNEETTEGVPTAFGSQGAFGFSPWVDRKRGIVGVLFVGSKLEAVNLQPTPALSPYTLIREKVAEVLDRR